MKGHDVKGYAPAWAFLVLALVLACLAASQALGQEPLHPDRISLAHLPEGEVIEVDGVQYMAYTLELFREVAQVDLSLQQCQLDLRVSQEEVEILSGSRESLEALLLESSERNQQILSALAEWAPPPAPQQGWLSWEHTPLEVALFAGWLTTVVVTR